MVFPQTGESRSQIVNSCIRQTTCRFGIESTTHRFIEYPAIRVIRSKSSRASACMYSQYETAKSPAGAALTIRLRVMAGVDGTKA
jgi:hypothetical protein